VKAGDAHGVAAVLLAYPYLQGRVRLSAR